MSIQISKIPECELPEIQKNPQICMPMNQQTNGFVLLSEIIKKNIPNYAHSFNIAEKQTTSTILSKKTYILQMSYHPDSLIDNQTFLTYITHSSINSFFHIFDATLFFINSINALHKANIFPLYLSTNNFTYFPNNNHPCLSNIHNCMVKLKNKQHNIIINDDFKNTKTNSSYLLSPDILALKFLISNQKTNITPNDATQLKNIINNSYQKYLPEYILLEIIPVIETYIDNIFTHMSSSSIIQYIQENSSNYAIFSIICFHIINIKTCFDINNNIIQKNFIKPIVKFLNPKFSYTIKDVFETIHEHLYIKLMETDITFNIIHQQKFYFQNE